MSSKKECKTFEIVFEKNPNPTIKLFCPFYEEITTMSNDIKWLKKFMKRRFYLEAGTIISILSLVISVLLVVARVE